MRTRDHILRLAAIGLACTSAVGCGEPGTEPERAVAHPANPVGASGATLFPDRSLRDWVSFADHVVVYTITAERRMSLDQDEIETGEGNVLRVMTLRIDDTLWSARRAPKLPGTIEMKAVGWALHDGKLIEMTLDDAPRVAVGERYVVPLAQVDFGNGARWWPLTPGSNMPVEGDAVKQASWHSATNRQLAGRSLDEIRALINDQPPDPIATKYAEMRPQDRVRAVMADPATPPDGG